MKNIAIIPARSGSKGLPDKNIKPLNGKPLVAYTIEAALESGVFDEVHLSTDSNLYADIGIKYGASVPFLRDQLTSSDSAGSWDVVKEVLKKYKELGKTFDTCTLLQPTSPLRDSIDVKRAFELFNDKNADSVVSVCEVDHPVQWCFELPPSLSMDKFNDNPFNNMRRQELPTNYRENGAIYIVKTKKFDDEVFNFYYPNCYAFKMSSSKSIDIDTETDFIIAQAITSNNLNK